MFQHVKMETGFWGFGVLGFWGFIFIAGLVACCMISYRAVQKFNRREVYTEIRSVSTDKNYFPAVTFCEPTLFYDSYFAYCGISIEKRLFKSQFLKINGSCQRQPSGYPDQTVAKKGRFWSNGIFNVTFCRSTSGKSCLSTAHLRSRQEFNHSCFTLNYAGDFHDLQGRIRIKFDFIPQPHFNKTEKIYAVPHDSQLLELDTTTMVPLEPERESFIKLEKTLVSRLPAPFPSNCTDHQDDYIYPGRYTRRNCVDSKNYLRMFKVCGAVTDHINQFIPTDVKEKYAKNRTIEEALFCIIMHIRNWNSETSECPFPCTSYDISVTQSSTAYKGETEYLILLQYQPVDFYRTVQERELYPWDEMLAEMGGLIGLIIGASVTSVIEILVYLCLIIWSKVFY